MAAQFFATKNLPKQRLSMKKLLIVLKNYKTKQADERLDLYVTEKREYTTTTCLAEISNREG
jgi:hypothetical protein